MIRCKENDEGTVEKRKVSQVCVKERRMGKVAQTAELSQPVKLRKSI